MRRRERRAFEVFSLSFLDVVCCGFGAIILLFVLNKMGEPVALERARQDMQALLARLEEELAAVRGETTVLNRDLRGREQQVSEERLKVARLSGDLSRVQGQYAASRELSVVQDIIAGRLLAAQQELSEEMKRLQKQQEEAYRRPPEAPVGGIPVDSEYVIFIIDTSGSMQRFAWPAVRRKMDEVLNAYPKVRGVQIMNDEGVYMFPTYSGKWIPDTPARRQAIRQRLTSWNAFSNSSPVEGIEAAIRTYWSADKRISLYVLGDEFTGDSIDDVLEEVDRLNRRDAQGQQKVRIHAIGFPTLFSQPQYPEDTGVRFATLMRILCERNGGAFVALNSTSP
ncbi:MAG TPA: VWA domain-containing protein [Vicinamibacteria bacterium]|nr:VWA domain-containing protein [Vicinamibacteria bacterium]